MKHLTTIALAVVLPVSFATVARADVRVTMRDGLVTIVASDVTVRQILAEWARVGQVTIVNGDRISGGPVTLEITNRPEKEALDILLRSVSGYLAAPRPTPVANAARFDRIMVMPTTAQPRNASSSAPPPLSQQPQQRPFQLQPLPPEFEDNPAFANPNINGDPQRQPTFTPVVPGGQTAPATAPGAGRGATPGASGPIGSSVPGVILPPPTPPTQPAR